MARTPSQNGTEKDSKEGLKMESSRQKETGKVENVEGDFKKIELTWKTAQREAKDIISRRKMSGCIILNV